MKWISRIPIIQRIDILSLWQPSRFNQRVMKISPPSLGLVCDGPFFQGSEISQRIKEVTMETFDGAPGILFELDLSFALIIGHDSARLVILILGDQHIAQFGQGGAVTEFE